MVAVQLMPARPALPVAPHLGGKRNLAKRVIERLRWPELLRRYDRLGTLFYLDPPYWGCETDYGAGMFGREEFAQMAEAMPALQGQFLLSLNDRPEVRALFKGCAIEAVGTSYRISGDATPAAELLISKRRKRGS